MMLFDSVESYGEVGDSGSRLMRNMPSVHTMLFKSFIEISITVAFK